MKWIEVKRVKQSEESGVIWGKAKWSEKKSNEVNYSEVQERWSSVKSSEVNRVKSSEVKYSKVQWNTMKQDQVWKGAKRSEVKRS